MDSVVEWQIPFGACTPEAVARVHDSPRADRVSRELPGVFLLPIPTPVDTLWRMSALLGLINLFDSGITREKVRPYLVIFGTAKSVDGLIAQNSFRWAQVYS